MKGFLNCFGSFRRSHGSDGFDAGRICRRVHSQSDRRLCNASIRNGSVRWSSWSRFPGILMLTLQTCKSLDTCFLTLWVKHVSQSIKICYLLKAFTVIFTSRIDCVFKSEGSMPCALLTHFCERPWALTWESVHVFMCKVVKLAQTHEHTLIILPQIILNPCCL